MEVASVIFGAIGMLTGIGGIVFACIAQKTAGRANLLAQDANQAAERANELSSESNDIAREANRVAVDANETAEETKSIHARQEARATERHDVRWEGGWEQPGCYVMVNLGEDEALDVEAIVTIEGHERKARSPRVPHRGRVVLDFTASANELAPEPNQVLSHDSANFIASAFGIEGLWTPGLSITEEVHWATPLGQQRTHGPDTFFTDDESFRQR